MDALTDGTVDAIRRERDRQTARWAGEHAWGEGDCSSRHVAPTVKAAVLTEECGEVARAVLDQDSDALHRELVQVAAAVAVAWLEGLS
jgi:NTP pyrophosphatase (non-canonical NTP hydrolase)